VLLPVRVHGYVLFDPKRGESGKIAAQRVCRKHHTAVGYSLVIYR
jgi:hypothetical protein